MTIKNKTEIRKLFNKYCDYIATEMDLPEILNVNLTFDDIGYAYYQMIENKPKINFCMNQYKKQYNDGVFKEYVKVATKINYPFGYIRYSGACYILTDDADEFILIHELAHAICDIYVNTILNHDSNFCNILGCLLLNFKPKVKNPFKIGNKYEPIQ